MTSLRQADGKTIARWGARARVVAGTTRREFAYRWTAPRSPAQRVLVAPLLLVAGLVAILVALFLLALMLAFALLLVALSVVWLFRAGVASRRRRSIPR